MRLHEIQDFIGGTLSQEAADSFGKHMEDMFYWVRSWALRVEMSEEQFKEKVNHMCKAIILEAIKVYLNKYYNHNWSVSSTRRDIIDGDMCVIGPIQIMKQKQREMIPSIEGEAMAEFCRGKNMARGIVSRARDMVARRISSPNSASWDVAQAAPRDYAEDPPVERLEIEMLGLERKLPGLSPGEATRLRELYGKLTHA